MSINDLSSLFTLFTEGLGIGCALGTLPFLIGYLINGIFNLIRKA